MGRTVGAFLRIPNCAIYRILSVVSSELVHLAEVRLFIKSVVLKMPNVGGKNTVALRRDNNNELEFSETLSSMVVLQEDTVGLLNDVNHTGCDWWWWSVSAKVQHDYLRV